jgi:hypothetical protein
MKLVGTLALLLLSGCAGSLEAARGPRAAHVDNTPGHVAVMVEGAPSERCAQLDDRHAFYGGISKGSAVLAGGAGLATVPVDDKGARIGLAIGAAVMAAVAATSTFIQEASSESWSRECAQ